jgi:UDP-galactose transporter
MAPADDADEHKAVTLLPRRWISWLAFCAVAALTTMYSMLVERSKRGDLRPGASLPYSPLSLTFIAEALKLFISVCLTYGPVARPPRVHLRGLANALLPAALYLLHNNTSFVAMRFLSPPMYQLLAQIKIPVTAALARVVLKQELTRRQHIGVMLLTLGSGVPGIAALTGVDEDGARNWVCGAIAMLFVAVTSGLAAVYTERMLKRDENGPSAGSLHFKNMQLYACGCGLYALPVYREWLASRQPLMSHLTTGWSAITYALVIVLTLQGLLISLLIKVADNFAKLFAGGAAIFMSLLLSVPVLGVVPGCPDVAGAFVVAIALWVFHHHGPPTHEGSRRVRDDPGAGGKGCASVQGGCRAGS